MAETAQKMHQFHLGLAQYKHIRALGWLFVLTLVVVAASALVCGILLWGTYTHGFTPYLKWQDALLSLSWFITFIAVGGIVLAGRFLHTLHTGYKRGMVSVVSNSICVRDLSSENIRSIFWAMNSAFWCFIAVLVGLFPVILIQWTLHLPSVLLIVLATSIAVLLGLVGVIVSLVALSFIVIGCIGCISFGRKLGSSYAYELNGRTKLSLNTFVLTIIQPDRPESMIDLQLLSVEDQSHLLSLLRTCWSDAEQKWSPEFGAEVTQAIEAVGV